MINYIVVYRDKYNLSPISYFLDGNYLDNPFLVINGLEDIAELTLRNACPEDNAVLVKETLLDYNSYKEDLKYMLPNLLNLLDNGIDSI